MFRHFLLASLLFFGLGTTSVWAVDIRADHPQSYTVVKGDTLWDISGRFLTHPWQWPEIWRANPDIKNPHLIYPGDVLELVYVDGKPQLRRKQSSSATARATGPIPPLPLDVIEPFLSEAHVIEELTADKSPYVLSFLDSSLIGGPGSRAYVRPLPPENTTTRFDIVRKGRTYEDAVTGEPLGFVARHVGRASLVRGGDPATVHVDEAVLEVARGDILIAPAEASLPMTFYPRSPVTPVEGRILDAYDSLTLLGRYQVVLIDRGAADGLAQGDVLFIDNVGRTVRDDIGPPVEAQEMREIGGVPQYGRTGPVYVTLPDERAGSAMVFRVFDRMSLALIMQSSRPVRHGDRVHHP